MMCKNKLEVMNNLTEDDFQMKCAPLLQRNPATVARYATLNESDYLNTILDELKTLFNKCDFDSRKNPPIEIHGDLSIPINLLHWPKAPSQPHFANGFSAITEIDFSNRGHRMIAEYAGSFSIKNAVIIAKFVGDENSHSFFIGEHDMLYARVRMGFINETPKAILFDSSGVSSPTIEFEEFTILTVTDGRYYKAYMEPRAVSDDLVIFTCFNKARGLYFDTVASFKDGLCDPADVFDGSDAMDVPASWAKNLPK